MSIDPSRRLSEHFTLGEFLKSQTALRRGIRNIPSETIISKLTAVCVNVLEPVRQHFGRPVVISSGYRSPALNAAIGGSKTSQHMKGEAADWEIPGIPNPAAAEWVHKNLNYDQLILEMYTRGQPNSGWIHVGYSGAPHKNQELTYTRVGGRMRYLTGLRP
jgi:hypothetical protein